MARPALDRLRDSASKRLFHSVLINDVDRLARDVAHLGVIKRDLERQGVRVVFRKLPSEASPTHNLMVNILGSFAEFERELIVDRTRRGKRHKIEVRRQYLGSKTSYGYSYLTADKTGSGQGRLEINPDEASVVRQMFAWVDQEPLSAHKVMGRLNELGIRPRLGKLWAKSSVLRILRNEMYAGTWYYGKHRKCAPVNPIRKRRYQGKSSNQLRPRGQWLPLALPEALHLIDRDRWQRVQKQLDRNLAFSPRNEKHSYLLKGLVRCGGCLARYVGDSNHGKFYYRCHRRCKKRPTIQEGSLDATVWDAVSGAIQKPEVIIESIRKLSRDRRQAVVGQRNELTETNRQLERLDQQEDRILQAYRSDLITAVQLGRQLDELNQKRTLFQSRIAALTTEGAKQPSRDSEEATREFCQEAARGLEEFDLSKRRSFLQLLLNEVVFEGSHVKIDAEIPIQGSDPGRSSDAPTDPNLLPPLDNSARVFAGGIATTSSRDCGRNPSDTNEPMSSLLGLSPLHCFRLTAKVLPPSVTPQPRNHHSGRFVPRKNSQ